MCVGRWPTAAGQARGNTVCRGVQILRCRQKLGFSDRPSGSCTAWGPRLGACLTREGGYLSRRGTTRRAPWALQRCAGHTQGRAMRGRHPIEPRTATVSCGRGAGNLAPGLCLRSVPLSREAASDRRKPIRARTPTSLAAVGIVTARSWRRVAPPEESGPLRGGVHDWTSRNELPPRRCTLNAE